ncbi:uncharacterized protein LOC120214252 [Hibiscus syriacus]|uniref:uncharacterized protein LOC120214252 n=1 Tax=Hibiscus syriacus TaxID=106335 RepID=UPI0019211DDB|nr:uncharacterized protein LOC120214252 [Hibiscus syriacus]
MGFVEVWIRMVMSCVSSMKYSVILNGSVTDSFIPSRGLHQGDPLSPFLFLICSESLSSLSSAKPPEIINYDKSNVFFSGNASNVKSQKFVVLLALEGQTVLKIISVFLPWWAEIKGGLSQDKRESSESYQSWSTKLLSLGGREVFIKLLLQSIPVYTMSIFLLPNNLYRELEAYRSILVAEISVKTWYPLVDLVLSHSAEDLWGHGDLGKFNIALLAKQRWGLISNPSSLVARLLRAKYFPNSSLLQASLGGHPSLIWRSIWSARRLIEMGIGWRIGNGHSVDIWNDYWLSEFPVRKLESNSAIRHGRVSDLIIRPENRWNDTFIRSIFNEADAKRIQKFGYLSLPQEDVLV